MKQQLKVTFRDQHSQEAVLRLTNPDGAELLRRDIRTVQGLNAVSLAIKYSGVMIITVETANCRWEKRLLFK